MGPTYKSDMSLRLGASKVVITPPRGTWMAGYRARTDGAAFVHDDVHLRCLALESGGERYAIVSIDVMGVDVGWTQELKGRAEAALQIPSGHLLVATSHTHAAQGGLFPFTGAVGRAHAAMMGDGCGDYDAVVAELLLRQALTALEGAFEALVPGSLAWATGAAPGIASNRIAPERPVDDSCVAVTALDAGGKVLAVLFHFTCHPTTLGEDDRGVSGDFAGEAARIAERALGDGAVALFLNGPLGDISTRYTRRGQGYGEVLRFGRLLGGEVVRLVGAARPLETRLSGTEVVVDLPARDRTRLDAIERRVRELAAIAGGDHGTARQLHTAREGAESAARSNDVVAALGTVPVPLQALSLGPELAFCGVPGELFSSAGEAIAAALPDRTVRVVAPANGYLGYFPTAEAFDAGGYEAGVSLVDRGGAEAIVRHAVALLAGTERELEAIDGAR